MTMDQNTYTATRKYRRALGRQEVGRRMRAYLGLIVVHYVTCEAEGAVE
jgi:hypothetical protein